MREQLKTYTIPWMSEEETARFLAEVNKMAMKRAATPESVPTDKQSSSSDQPAAPHLTIGGL